MAGKRIILLGDSIIDNGVYVKPGEPCVAGQLQALRPLDLVKRRALDGAVCADVLKAQFGDFEPNDYIVLSCGGNDALQHIEMLDTTFQTVSRNVLIGLWRLRENFRSDYRALLDALAATGRPVLAMTVYNPCFEGYGMAAEDQRAAESALSIFNDVIQQEARSRSFDVLEIRAIFTDAADYANPIEPSATGGAKLAVAISAWLEAAGADHLANTPPGPR
jgi:lysophospholipase L1-like esterase